MNHRHDRREGSHFGGQEGGSEEELAYTGATWPKAVYSAPSLTLTLAMSGTASKVSEERRNQQHDGRGPQEA